jgi:hypothetical protein
MVQHHADPRVRALREGPLAAYGRASPGLARCLCDAAAGKTAPAADQLGDLRIRDVVVDGAIALGLLAGATPEAIQALRAPPATSTPATGMPATGMPATGTPATGMPVTGAPATGTPATGTPPGTDAASTTAAPAAPSAKHILGQAQRENWLTRREAEHASAAIGMRALVGSLERNRQKQKLSKVRAMIEQLEHVPTDPALAPPLTSRSLIVDTNMVDALVLPRSSLSALELVFRESVEALIREHDIADLRLANMNIAETASHGDVIGKSFRLEGPQPRELRWFGVPLEPGVVRDKGVYNKLFRELKDGGVGEDKGNEDRSMVADAFFADMAEEPEVPPPSASATTAPATTAPASTAPASTAPATPPRMIKAVPQLATADKGIYNALMRMTRGRDGARLDPADYKEARTHDALVRDLAGRTGARYFAPTIQGRQLVVHPLVKPNAPRDATATGATATGATAAPAAAAAPRASDSPLDAPVGSHTVRDLMQLIESTGYGAMIVGGAVRDSLVKKAPKDVDIKTNLPLPDLEALLRSAKGWAELVQGRTVELHLLKVGVPPNLIDVSCGADGTKPGAFDAKADAPTRDFRMNAIYMDSAGQLVDPLHGRDDLPGATDGRPGGRIRFAVDPGPKDPKRPSADVAARMALILPFLKTQPWLLGRALKFLTRGYQLEPEIFDGLRDSAEAILGALGATGTPVKDRSLVIYKTDIKTPDELIELLRRFHFPPAAIRMILPDSVAGQFNRDVAAHERDVMPRTRGVPETAKPLGAPELKVDVSTGRIYQYRIHATAPAVVRGQREEPILIDVDCTNHDVSGHPAPHHHIYRWFPEGWKKQHSGLSATGQAGMPLLDGATYLGPQPWRWLDGVTGGDRLLVDVATVGERAGVAVEVRDPMVDLGGQVTVHRALLARVFAQGRLDELFLVVRNLAAGHEIDPDDPQIQQMIGSAQGQFRLRFSPQLAHVDPFLRSCGIAEDHKLFAKLGRGHRMRLFDLVNADIPEPQRKPAAIWALTGAATVDQFVQRFEFYLAAHTARATGSDALDAAWSAAVQAVRSAGAVGGTKLGSGALPEQIKAVAAALRFDSETTAAYHLQKHLEELGPSSSHDPAAAATAYLAHARDGVAGADKIEEAGEDSGDASLVMWKGARKTVVRIAADRTAYLVTCFTSARGLRAQSAAPRQIRQAVVPEPPKPDPLRVKAKGAAKELKVGSLHPYRDEAIASGTRVMCEVLSLEKARARGVTEPAAVDGNDEPALVVVDGALRVCVLPKDMRYTHRSDVDPVPARLAGRVLQLPTD